MKLLLSLFLLLSLWLLSACRSTVEATDPRLDIAEACLRDHLAGWLDVPQTPQFVTFCDFQKIGVPVISIKNRFRYLPVKIEDAALASSDDKGQVWHSALKMNGEIVALTDLKFIGPDKAKVTLTYRGAPTYGGRRIYDLTLKKGRWSVAHVDTLRISQIRRPWFDLIQQPTA